MYKASGKIIVAFPRTNGVTRDNRDWEKREYVLEADDRYRSKMRFSMMSFDGEIENPPAVGDMVNIGFTIECREYKENWFNDIRAYQIEIL